MLKGAALPGFALSSYQGMAWGVKNRTILGLELFLKRHPLLLDQSCSAISPSLYCFLCALKGLSWSTLFTNTLGLKEIFIQQSGWHQPLWWTDNTDLWRVNYYSFWKTCPYYFSITSYIVEVVNNSEKEVNIMVYTLIARFTEYPALEQILSFLPNYTEDTDFTLSRVEKWRITKTLTRMQHYQSMLPFSFSI